MTEALLVLNAGSSSLKFALYAAGALDRLCRGNVEGIGGSVRVLVSGPEAAAFGDPPAGLSSHADAVEWVLRAIRHSPSLDLRAAGHRVVHGGREFADPVLVDSGVLRRLEALMPLAPAHQPNNLAAIDAVAEIWPDLPQVACFDTAFHRDQPRLAQLFPIPRALSEDGLIRYGFHGLSYEHVASVLPELVGEGAEGRVLAAHLGHGASLCAISGRRSIATTMGLTALDGLMMGKRSGAVDPGLVLHLVRERGVSADEVAAILNERSGLLGVSELSDDVRELEASSDPRAVEALDLFAYRAVREAGSLIAALGGLDVLVFTGGIGEHSARMRAKICDGLAWLGLELDSEGNEAGRTRISREGSKVGAFVVAADEELQIARRVSQALPSILVPNPIA